VLNARRDDEVAEIQTKLSILSPREAEVLNGLIAGHANKLIAYELGISARTVEVHRANVMTKMGAASLSVLVRMVLVARSSPAPRD
jgi:two-component system response regulator FixJ